MLLDLKKLINKWDIKITGLAQFGANTGQEVPLFESLGITNIHLIEPYLPAFDKLYDTYGDKGYHFYMSAVSNTWEMGEIYVANFNDGQSSSLLKPKIHKEYYPDIVFDEKQEVQIWPIDEFHFKSDVNFFVFDIQGNELNALKGATETLKHIDYIYTEVNREELYENCAMVEDLDNYLTEFRRVETKWKRKGFGDALYIRKTLL